MVNMKSHAQLKSRLSNSKLLATCTGIALMLLACKKNSTDQGDILAAHRRPTNNVAITEESIKNLVIVGAPKSNVDKSLGMPMSVDPIGNGFVVAHYLFPIQPGDLRNAWENKLSGIVVTYSNDSVARWEPTYSSFYRGTDTNDHVPPTIATSTHYSGTSFKTLTFYILANGPVMSSSNADPRNSVDIHNEALKPVITITNVKSITESAGNTGSNDRASGDAIIIKLNDTDAEAFKRITEQNIGQYVVMKLGDRSITTNIIMMPIEGGELAIAGGTKEEYVRLRNELFDFSHQRPN
jgi:hypothetical protein